MVEIIVKEEYKTLDKTNFTQVCELVDRIIADIQETSTLETNDEWRDELKMAMVKDYMIDLINPDLLDFDKETYT